MITRGVPRDDDEELLLDERRRLAFDSEAGVRDRFFIVGEVRDLDRERVRIRSLGVDLPKDLLRCRAGV